MARNRQRKIEESEWRERLLFDLSNVGKAHCWCCGRDESQPYSNWSAPWFMQLAHLRSGGGVRAIDRRAVNVLCPMCHELHTHTGGSWRMKRINGVLYPTISDASMLWLKRERDGSNYDERYLSTLWIGNLPEPEQPADYWLAEYRMRRERFNVRSSVK